MLGSRSAAFGSRSELNLVCVARFAGLGWLPSAPSAPPLVLYFCTQWSRSDGVLVVARRLAVVLLWRAVPPSVLSNVGGLARPLCMLIHLFSLLSLSPLSL